MEALALFFCVVTASGSASHSISKATHERIVTGFLLDAVDEILLIFVSPEKFIIVVSDFMLTIVS